MSDKIVLKAEAFAADAHKGQLYGDLPFIIHPRSVVHQLLFNLVTHSNIIAAAWLHDVVEDTVYTVKDIEEEFGERIAELVYLLTDKEGKNRRERQLLTYSAIKKDPQACLIKLADRTCNVLASLHSSDNLFGMYKSEHDFFKEHIYKDADECQHIAHPVMQTTLDTLLYRGRYK